MADSLVLQGQVIINADTVPDGDEKRIPTYTEIEDWNNGTGGGGPFIGSLDDVPDSETRLAMTVPERELLATYTAGQGTVGDTHALRLDNPHATTAEQVGAVTPDDLAAHADDTDNPHETTAAQVGAATTATVAALDSRVEALEGGTPGYRWITGPTLVGNSQGFTAQPAASTEWTSSFYQKVYLSKASKLRAWVKIPTAGYSTAVVFPRYTTDLTGATGWTDITGMNISLAATAPKGIVSAIVDIPSGALAENGVLLTVAGSGGDATATPQITNYRVDWYDSANVAGATIELPIGMDDTTDDTAGTGRLALTNAERSKLTNLPSDTNASISALVSSISEKAGQDSFDGLAATVDEHEDTIATLATQASLADLADVVDTKASEADLADGLAGKASLPVGLADTTDSTASGGRLALTTAERGKLALVPADTITALAGKSASVHTHTVAQVDTLQATLTSLQDQINELGGGAGNTQAVLTVTSAAAVNLPEADVIYIEHSGVFANVRIPASLSKKAHVLVLLGGPNTVNIAGAVGAGQTIKGSTGSGLTFASGTDAQAVSRILIPDPDTTNYPHRWRIF